MLLSARKVETAKPGRYTDGRGLTLLVKASGARSWVLRYQIDGRRRDMGLGAWPEVTLAMARERTLAARREMAEGRDPLTERGRAKRLLFRDAAATLIEDKRQGWRNEKHAAQWTSTLETYAYGALGDLDVRVISVQEVLQALRPIWTDKPETASRVRQRIEAVLDYASAIGARSGDNPARWKGHLDHILPRPAKVRAVAHHPAMDRRALPAFMAALAQHGGMGARALAFTILTAARSGETRGARWSEIDINAALWIIPADRMKAGKEHRVPLSAAAIAQLPKRRGADDIVFSGGKTLDRPLSDMSLSAVLKRMKVAGVTVHGFRSTFRDWAGETTQFPREVIEAALSHRLKDKAEAAYARGDMLTKRAALMHAWAGATSIH